MKTPPSFPITFLLSHGGQLMAQVSVPLASGRQAVAHYIRNQPRFEPAGVTCDGQVIPWQSLSTADQAAILQAKAAMTQVYHHDERLRFKTGRPSSLKLVLLLRLAERAGVAVDDLIRLLRARINACESAPELL